MIGQTVSIRLWSVSLKLSSGWLLPVSCWGLEHIGTESVSVIELIVESVVVVEARGRRCGCLGVSVKVGEAVGRVGKVVPDLFQVHMEPVYTRGKIFNFLCVCYIFLLCYKIPL